MTMADELLPCRWCGEIPEPYSRSEDEDAAQIRCICGRRGPWVEIEEAPADINVEAAIKQWNRENARVARPSGAEALRAAESELSAIADGSFDSYCENCHNHGENKMREIAVKALPKIRAALAGGEVK